MGSGKASAGRKSIAGNILGNERLLETDRQRKSDRGKKKIGFPILLVCFLGGRSRNLITGHALRPKERRTSARITRRRKTWLRKNGHRAENAERRSGPNPRKVAVGRSRS